MTVKQWSSFNLHVYLCSHAFSLNREKRQRELLRVTKENQEILKRIMLRKPEYSAQKWQDEWEDNQAFLDNISHFPKEWWVEEKVNKVCAIFR